MRLLLLLFGLLTAVLGFAAPTQAQPARTERIEAELAEFLERADDRTVRDDDRLEEAIRKITRQVAMEEIGKKPEVTVIISRLAAE